MKNTWKKLLAMTLVVSMTMGMLSVGTLAADGTEEEQTSETYCGKEEHTHDDGCYKLTCGKEEGELTYELSPDTKTPHSHKDECYELTCDKTEHTHSSECYVSVSWDAETGTLTIIGTNYLDQATALAYVKELGAKSTDVKALVLNDVTEIAPYAFHQTLWTALETVTIDGTDTIGGHAFSGAKALTTVTLTNVNQVGTSVSESLQGNAFAECKALKSLTMNNVGTLGAETFRQCSALDGALSLTRNNVGTMGRSPFSYCIGLTGVELDGVKMDGGTSFFNCSGIQTVTVKNTEISDGAFTGCTSLTSVTLENVDSIGKRAFSAYIGGGNCTALETVNMANVTATGNEAFVGCSSLKNVNMTNVAIIDTNSFASCKALETITIPDGVQTINQYAFYNCTGLKSVTMGKVDTIDQYAFWNCSNLETIDSLSNVKNRIGGFAFYGCSSLTGLTVEDMTKMGYNGSIEMMERMQAILAGKFHLDNAEEITELVEEDGWAVGAVDKSDNWNSYNNGTQLMEQARWQDAENGVAQVKVDAYYTGEKQMDYIFVADLSASMAQLGNPEDSNARFYDMQSKLLDMTGQLLNAPGYDCQVAIVTFGGLFKNSETCNTLGFTKNAGEVASHIKALEPLNENTDYGLGLKAALDVVKGQAEGRNTVVVFLSDGAPTANGSGDQDGTKAAAEIKALNIPIYGVLHSPTAAQHDKALGKMQAVCGENTVYESTDTKTFGEAMNAAFAAVYGDNTVTIPVNAEVFDMSDLELSAGTAEYRDGVITWTIGDMPFAQHTLTYNLMLKDELANRVGSYRYGINNGEATFGEGKATISLELELTLERTIYTVTYTDGVNGTAFANQTTNVVAGKATPAFVGTPSRSGYSFTGWSPAVTETVNANVTYTAGWSSDDDGGDDDDGPTTPTPRPTETPNPVVSPEPTGTPEPTPRATPVIEDLGENDTPLAELPTETQQPATEPPKEEIEELEDEDVPMAQAPETGDNLGTWLMMSAGALLGLAWLGRKKEEA